MEGLLALLLVAIGLSGAIVLFAALYSLPVYLLWNWVAVGALGLHPITWLQAWGLLTLCGFLFRTSVTTKKD